METQEGTRTTFNGRRASQRLPVRAASHASIAFDVAAPERGEVVVEYLNRGHLLARECRPLNAGDTSLELKTHPRASHIVSSMRAGDRPMDGVRFNVDCGRRIEPTGRHFIVIGAMKAGTTTLFELLAQHPALCRTWVELPGVSFTKEINYFLHLYRKSHTSVDYDWRFPFDATRHAWTLDVSPGYAKWPRSKGVPERIASLGGETKLAYILRDPVDRIESHFAHMLYHRGEIKSMQHCIRTSRYAWQLDQFMGHVDRDDVLLLDFEELQRDPAAILAKICDFLGIARVTSHSKVHNTRGVDFRLDPEKRKKLTTVLRPDVKRLFNAYGFTPAETWLRDGT